MRLMTLIYHLNLKILYMYTEPKQNVPSVIEFQCVSVCGFDGCRYVHAQLNHIKVPCIYIVWSEKGK